MPSERGDSSFSAGAGSGHKMGGRLAAVSGLKATWRPKVLLGPSVIPEGV